MQCQYGVFGQPKAKWKNNKKGKMCQKKLPQKNQTEPDVKLQTGNRS